MPSTEDVKARMLLEQLEENVAIIAPYLKSPEDHAPGNARVYRSVYVSRGTVVCAGISAMVGRQPSVVIHRVWSSAGEQSPILKFNGPTSPYEAAVFLGLDSCYPRIPVWTKESLSESGLIVAHGGLNGNSPL